jgi:hypothetical protein
MHAEEAPSRVHRHASTPPGRSERKYWPLNSTWKIAQSLWLLGFIIDFQYTLTLTTTLSLSNGFG